jgi:hypothetical protein
MQGGCGQVTYIGVEQTAYPCAHHRGLDFPLISGNTIQQTGQDIGRPLWRTAPSGETAPRSELCAVPTA